MGALGAGDSTCWAESVMRALAAAADEGDGSGGVSEAPGGSGGGVVVVIFFLILGLIGSSGDMGTLETLGRRGSFSSGVRRLCDAVGVAVEVPPPVSERFECRRRDE